MAWEVEKIEIARQHDFEMNIQRKDLENQLSMDKDARGKAELDNKMAALDDAVERGDIPPEDARQEKLRLEIGVSDRFSVLAPKSAEDQFYSRFIDKAQGTAPLTEQSSVDKLSAMIPGLSSEDQSFAEAVVERGNLTEIKSTLDTLEVTAAAEKEEKKLATDTAFLERKLPSLDADKKAVIQRALESRNPLQIEASADSLRELERREKRRTTLSITAREKIQTRKESKERREIEVSLGVRNIRDFQKTSLQHRLGGL